MKIARVTTLGRKAAGLINEVAADHLPVVITQHGLPTAYIVDVATFHAMESRLQLLEGIAKGEKAIQDGRIVSHQEARNRHSRWLE